jgi:signal transduction histidine kinase
MAEGPTPPKRVLVLMPFQVSRPGSVALLRGMEDGLRASYPGGVEMVTDSVTPVPPEPDGFADRMSDWLAYKYGHQHFDAVVSVINPPIPYAVALRDRFWPEDPILFVLQEEERKMFPQSVRRSSQVVTALSNTETLRSALQMFPRTEHLVYLEGNSEQDRQANAEILGNIRQAYPTLDIIEIQGLSWGETKEKVRSLPDRSILLIGSFLFDRNHRQLAVPQQAEELSALVSVPVIADSDLAVGKGVIGGSVLSVQGAGKVVGEQLADLLQGANPDRLPVREVKNSYIVDWRQLRRWGVPESRLPVDATILYKPPTAWDQYKGYIVAVGIVLALLLALVTFLLIERARRRKEEGLNAAMRQSLPGLALLVSAQGEILRTNQVDSEATGSDLIDGARPGRKYCDYLQEVEGRENAISSATVIEQVIAGSRPRATVEVLLSSGDRWVEIRAIQLPKEHSSSLVVHLDITQRKQAELERIRSRTEIFHLNRVAAMGQLAAALAHELSQPLAAILSNAEAAQRFANRENPDLTEIREALHDIAQDDRRARGVIQGMRAMLKKEDLKVEPVDLNHIASSVAQMVRNEATLRGMSIRVSLRPSPMMVKGDPIALQQVLLNLASNGLDAMTGSEGTRCLTIRTLGGSNGKTATVWVDDEGPGVSHESLDKLFQPFFTTKRMGLGMGLSICQSIVDSLGGHIDVKNRGGRGASFSVTLPAA